MIENTNILYGIINRSVRRFLLMFLSILIIKPNRN